MGDDTSDILGTHNIPIVRGSSSGRWIGPSFGVKSVFAVVVTLALYLVGRRLWESLLIWREKSYKLSMRRRHGIPDNDHRPFNVAYAAAMRARQEIEAAKRKVELEEAALGQNHRNALPDQNLRLRPVSGQRSMQTAWQNGTITSLPGGLNHSSHDPSSLLGNTPYINHGSGYATPANPLNLTDRYSPDPVVRMSDSEFDPSPPRAGPSRRSSRKNLNISGDDEGRKRAFDGEEFEEFDHPKKSRVEGEELIDGDEDPEWEEHGHIPQRGSKRVLADEDEIGETLSKRARDKRARKVSLENAPLYQSDDMEIDENEDDDEVAELKSISRGKKRDRAEAGSTFGGDDEDSAHEVEAEEDLKARRRRRKRRTVGKRKSDAGSSIRGQKRDRDAEEDDSDFEDVNGGLLKVSRKKRGRRSASTSLQDEEERRGGSDLSMDGSQTSSSRERGRRIGDEWESNGVMFKIGPNGQRLRQALIKKARQKFNMPVDSQHPDRDANLEVCVETWLTEEEFKEAKAQRMLAWQDSPMASTEPESPSFDVKDPPSPPPAGKNLLWRSRSAAPSPLSHLPAQSTPPRQMMDPHRQSITTNFGLRLDPFQQKAPSGKRIASGARVASVFSGHAIPSSFPSPGLTDSTNGSPRNGYRTFSKWEKQDLEAKAMMKMREANLKKQAEREQKDREEKEKAEKERKEKEAAAAAKSTPTITITAPAETKPTQAEVKPPTLSFTPPVPSESAKGETSKQTSFFGPPPGASAPPFTLGAAPPLKSEDKPPAKSATPQPSTSGSTFLANPSSGLPPKPAAPLFSGLATDNKTQQSKTPSAFSFPPPQKPTNASTAGNSARVGFSLGSTPSQPPLSLAVDGQGTTNANSGSLLSRVNPSAQPAAPQQQQQQPSAFTFNKPAASEAQKPSSVFGNITTQASTSAPATVTNTTGATSKPKFDFGVSNKLPPSSVPAPAAPTSSLSGALGPNTAKPTSAPGPLSFNFKIPAAPASATSGTNSGTTAPKFSFAAPSSSGTAFGGTNTFGGNKAPVPAATSQSDDVQTKPPTFGATPGFGVNLFGGNKDSTATSAAPQSSDNQTQSSLFGSTNSFSASPFSTFGESKGSTPATAPQSNELQNRPSTFNTTNPPPVPFGGDKPNDAAVKSVFTGFGSGTQGTSFGASSGVGVFGTSNVFGNSGGGGAKPVESKTTFSWPSNSSAPAATNTGEASKPAFSFASQTVTPISASPAASGGSSQFSAFKFGDTSKTPSTTLHQLSTTGQFGSTPAGTTPSSFGFTAPPTANNAGTTAGFGNTFGNAFGNTSTSTTEEQK